MKRFGSMGIVVIIGVAVVVVVGLFILIGSSSKKTTSTNSAQEAIQNATCDYSDEDLCKFFTIRKKVTPYTLTHTAGSGSTQTVTTVQSKNATTFALKISGPVNYETITIGNAYYIKAGDGTWWKQTIPKDEANKYTSNLNDELVEPSSKTVSSDRPYYEKQGTESCGSETCFKYQMTDPTDAANKTFIWFDTSDYKLRRMQNTGTANPFNATYVYGDVTVEVPTPVQDLAPNQTLPPGQSAPITSDQSQQPPALPDDYQYE